VIPTIALLTIREALNRRILAALVALTLVVVVATAWGFAKVSEVTGGSNVSGVTVNLIVSQLLVMLMFMFSFVLGMTAVFVTSPAIAGDVDSGVALAILARPIRRAEVLLGKWLGNVVVLVVYAIAGGALELAVVRITTGYVPPEPVAFLLYLAAETVIGVTLAILLSTFIAPMAGGAIAVVCFGLVWLAGIAGSIGEILANDTLVRVGVVTRLLLPTDGLWRGAMFSLEPLALVSAAGRATALVGNPFLAQAAPTTPFLVWCAVWVVAVLAGAVFVFRSREI
jgi:ABC-type transport system involved in multi-copper enzyme maturation permease subunit